MIPSYMEAYHACGPLPFDGRWWGLTPLTYGRWRAQVVTPGGAVEDEW